MHRFGGDAPRSHDEIKLLFRLEASNILAEMIAPARWADRRRLPHEDLDTAYAGGPASSEMQARNGQLQSLSRHRPNLFAEPSWNRPFS